MFGYPNLSHIGTLQHHGSLPPVPLPRLNLQAAQRASSIRPPESTSSEEEDKVDLLGRSFQVPRPKSRSNASIAVSRYLVGKLVTITKIVNQPKLVVGFTKCSI